jgi:hypothetical protein
MRYVSSTGDLIMNTVSQYYSHSTLHIPQNKYPNERKNKEVETGGAGCAGE